ncbi:MAG: sirohydrochlorin cobaltochelatase [Prevotella sp.]|nr:sirohydrochlorin cobaltochelatase [Prevotella sp.]
MKKINSLLVAMMAISMLASLTSCSDDDESMVRDNMAIYQKRVNTEVEANKKGDKALLLVVFGSTWQKAFDTFDKTVTAYKQEFPGYDVYISFSSAICRNNAATGVHKYENTEIRNYYAPENYLRAFGKVKYNTIVVQSLQVIPGEEYARVVNDVKNFCNNQYRDMAGDYLSNVDVYLGAPLMATVGDVKTVAAALNTNLAAKANDGVVALMGHGNPDTYDTYSANIRYTQLEEELQKLNRNYFVGTVDMKDNFVDDVHARMVAAGITSGNVHCYPLMSIAGDHAHNDMVEDWGGYFTEKGYRNDYTLEGLLDYRNIRNIWINHTKVAIAGDPVEWNKQSEE